MRGKFWGGVLLIVGTSIGAGMLALPLVMRSLGVLPAMLLLVSAWFAMTLPALFILQVNLTLPHRTHMVSMAKHTLGKGGQAITWVSYCMLLFCLLAAYIAGGADLLSNLFHVFHFSVPHWLAIILFVALFGAIIFQGVRIVDLFNRGLMSIKLGSFAILMILLLMHGHFHAFLALPVTPIWSHMPTATLVVITSFGFAVIVPSLRDYFGENDHLMFRAILFGSLVPLVCYMIWVLLVMGVVPSSVPITQLSELLSTLHRMTHMPLINEFVHLFTYICVTTSFLGVSLALMDFLADGFQLPRHGAGRWLNMALTFLPPSLVVMFDPGLFVKGLSLAGVFCVILLMLLPALMVFRTHAKMRLWAVLEILIVIALALVGLYWLVHHGYAG